MMGRPKGPSSWIRTRWFARKLWLGEGGATIIEYVLLLMFVAMACFAAVSALGSSLSGPFQRAINGMS